MSNFIQVAYQRFLALSPTPSRVEQRHLFYLECGFLFHLRPHDFKGITSRIDEADSDDQAEHMDREDDTRRYGRNPLRLVESNRFLHLLRAPLGQGTLLTWQGMTVGPMTSSPHKPSALLRQPRGADWVRVVMWRRIHLWQHLFRPCAV